MYVFKLLNAFRRLDPAARNPFEVFFLYPGFKAVLLHQLNHRLYKMKIPFVPRFLCEFSRFLTGIEIHPGAKLGVVVIDHGMGVVMGETSVVGDDVLIYQGVTLGGATLDPVKRHPTIEDRVIIGAGAKIIGNIIIGSGSRIGTNSVVVNSVGPNSTVVGIPGKTIIKGVTPGKELDHYDI